MTTMTASHETANTQAFSQPRIFAHLNGLAIFIASLVAYGIYSGDWLAFIVLLLVPDVSFVGYKINTRIGAWIYNAVHSYVLAVAIILASYALGWSAGIAFGIILFAHIGMDQAVGYGYKYADGKFSDTHYGRI